MKVFNSGQQKCKRILKFTIILFFLLISGAYSQQVSVVTHSYGVVNLAERINCFIKCPCHPCKNYSYDSCHNCFKLPDRSRFGENEEMLKEIYDNYEKVFAEFENLFTQVNDLKKKTRTKLIYNKNKDKKLKLDLIELENMESNMNLFYKKLIFQLQLETWYNGELGNIMLKNK